MQAPHRKRLQKITNQFHGDFGGGTFLPFIKFSVMTDLPANNQFPNSSIRQWSDVFSQDQVHFVGGLMPENT